MTRKFVLILVSLLVISISFSYSINNTSGISVDETTLDPLVQSFETDHSMHIDKIDIYFDKFVLSYKIYGYTEEQQGLTTIKTPRIYILDENWNIIREDVGERIGARAFLLGVPGAILYLVFTFAGWV
jgi:hypothetical protein